MADNIATAYVQIEPTFEGVGKKLKGGITPEAGSAGKEAGGSFGEGFASVMGSAVKVGATALVGAVSVGSAAVTKLTSDAAANFGEYEQLVGGLETMFEDLSWDVEQNANQAFQTAGLSANEYMETVMGFSAALTSSLQASEGNIARSADLSDQIVRDMSDNANKMGSSMESIQNAYSGFAKQNYTMLDNLKLGYGGTKTEMERLLADAQKISGIEYNIESFADVTEAIHVIQTEMGITGTTAKEASSTLQGSFASMASAWQNVLTSLGSGENLDKNLSDLVNTAETYIGNLLPVIETALGGVSELITNLAPVIADKLPGLVSAILPSLLTAAGDIIGAVGDALIATMPVLVTTGADILNQLIQGILQGLPELIPMVIELLGTIGNGIMENLPLLLAAAVQIIVSLATGIAQALPELIPTIVDVVTNIAIYLVENVDLLLDAALQLMIGLATGLINALPVLIEKAPVIIGKLFTAFLNAIPKLMEAGAKIIKIIIEGLVKNVPLLIGKVPELINDLKARFLAFIPEFLRVGSEIVNGIKEGISNAWDAFTNWMHSLLDGFVDGILSFFGISSPSKLMAEEVGQWIPAGIAEGIEKGMGILDRTVDDMTSDMMSTTLSPSMVQNYTPQANTANSDLSGLMTLLQTYLPQIAAGENVNISLEGDAGRLFRMMQMESIRNTQIVGTGAVLSAI